MLSKNKWVNLLIFLLCAFIISLVVVHATKVVDKNGKDTGNTLKTFGGSSSTTTTTTK